MTGKLRIFGYCNKGFEGLSVNINCDIHNGFPGFDIIGLPDKVISESKELIRSALRNTGFKFPQQKVLISLTPASIQKSGSFLELGIALGILFASTKPSSNGSEIRVMTAGELNLDGSIVQDAGALGAVKAAEKLKCHICLVPFEVTDKPGVYCVKSLSDAFVKTGEALTCSDFMNMKDLKSADNPSVFNGIIGMNREKEILSLAACSNHSILLFGPPGVGKTMLSGIINKLMPKHTESEQLTLKQIYGCASASLDDYSAPISTLIPHDCLPIQFTGGTASKSPGLGAMSHKAAVILDELNKYTPSLLESVKDTYDKGYTVNCRSGEAVIYPARFLMTASMNACSCGNLGSFKGTCTCTAQKISSYWNKIGKALIDRFSIRLPVPEYDIASLSCEHQKDDSYYIDKINIALDRQKKNLKGSGITQNGDIRFASNPFSLLRKETLLYTKLFQNRGTNINARFQIELISLARSIADFNDRDNVTEEDFEKAVELRRYCTGGDYYWRQINN